jgi:hypothetical protein
MNRLGKTDRSQISTELSRLLAQQTEFFQKTARTEPSRAELEEFRKSGDRVRQLFAELEGLNKAA